MLTPFHLAIQVRDIAESREFYGTKMGLPEGRSDTDWIDFNMFGHQVVTHLNPALGRTGKVTNHRNPVDAKAVPVPHFGVVLEVETWKVFPSEFARLSMNLSSSLTSDFRDSRVNSTPCSLKIRAETHWSSRPLPISKQSYSPRRVNKLHEMLVGSLAMND